MVLKTCKARQCTHPWEVIHPLGDVNSLQDALDSQFDELYEVQQQRVHFSQCEKGYILESEGPMGVMQFGVGDVGVNGGARWADLV